MRQYSVRARSGRARSEPRIGKSEREPHDRLAQDEMADAENATRRSCRQRVEPRSRHQQESAGEEAADCDHTEQPTLGEHVKQGTVRFERLWKRVPVDDIRPFEMRAGSEPKRS
jgi:hypothetical protein